MSIKSFSFKEKLEKVHNIEDQIFNLYSVDIHNFYCPHCNSKRLKPYRSNNQGSYIKLKCYGCNIDFDVLDIVKIVDERLKNFKTGAVVDYLLSIDYTNVSSIPQLKEKTENLLDNDYDEFIADSLNKFNNAVNTNNSQELEYLYSRGYTHQDLELLKNFLGLDVDNNIVFACSIESYILRLLKPWHDKKKDKEIRYQNSVKLKNTRHYCFLFDTVNQENVIKNDYNIFIFEGVFDTITFRILCKNKCLAFATGGADSNHSLIADRINDIASQLDHKINIFILFDNDEAGENNTSLLAELFNKSYINVYTKLSKFLFKNSKDISDELKNNRAELQERINCLINKIS